MTVTDQVWPSRIDVHLANRNQTERFQRSGRESESRNSQILRMPFKIQTILLFFLSTGFNLFLTPNGTFAECRVLSIMIGSLANLATIAGTVLSSGWRLQSNISVAEFGFQLPDARRPASHLGETLLKEQTFQILKWGIRNAIFTHLKLDDCRVKLKIVWDDLEKNRWRFRFESNFPIDFQWLRYRSCDRASCTATLIKVCHQSYFVDHSMPPLDWVLISTLFRSKTVSIFEVMPAGCRAAGLWLV